MQYYKGAHGIHISYNPAEREGLEATGWTLIGDEHDFLAHCNPKTTNKLSANLEDKSVEELRAIAKDKGIIVHHKAGASSIIEKIEAA